MQSFSSWYSENLNRNDWIRLPSDVSTTMWESANPKPSITTGFLWGHGTDSRLSMRSVSVAGLYSPPGDILVGGSGELGSTQRAPRLLLASVAACWAKELAHRNAVHTSRAVFISSRNSSIPTPLSPSIPS